jgi:hypothetical protein
MEMVRLSALAIFFVPCEYFSWLDFLLYCSTALSILDLNTRGKDNFLVNLNVKMPDSCMKWPFLTVILRPGRRAIRFLTIEKTFTHLI